MKKYIPLLLVLGLVSVAYAITYITGTTLYTYSSQAKPVKGGSFVDSTYNTTITRLTNAPTDGASQWGMTTEYSTWNCESSDGNYLVLLGLSAVNSSGDYCLYSSTGALICSLDPYEIQQWNGQEPEARWDQSGLHPTWLYYRKGMQLRYLDVATLTTHLVHDFTGDIPGGYTSGYYIWNGDEGSCSDDSRYWSFMYGNSNTHQTYIISYDKTSNTVIGIKATNGNYANSVSVSKSGSYVYVAWWGSGNPRMYPISLSGTGYQACLDVPHGCWAIDKQGRDVFVYLNYYDVEDEIGFTRADNGVSYECYPQSGMGWDSGTLFSAPGANCKGWAVCSVYGDDTNSYWPNNRIFMIELDEEKTYYATAPEIWQVAFTQCYTNSSYAYYSQTNATINKAGTRIYFTSNWRSTSAAPDVYKVDLPSSWYTDFGGIQASTVTCTSTVSASSSTVGTTLIFTSTATTTSGSISSYSWNFGDGVIENTQDATHSYTSPGAYTATVTATDSNGSQGTSSEGITISERIIHYNAVINKAYVTNLYTQ